MLLDQQRARFLVRRAHEKRQDIFADKKVGEGEIAREEDEANEERQID